MIVSEYNPKQGIYAFDEQGLVTDFHDHPAMEIILATSGCFDLHLNDRVLTGIQAAIVPPNVIHALDAVEATCRITMIEPVFLYQNHLEKSLELVNSSNTATSLAIPLAAMLDVAYFEKLLDKIDIEGAQDDRILTSIAFLESNAHLRQVTLTELAAQVHLSPGRLSHLFRDKMGVTIQKFQIWCRLKKAINGYLTGNGNLQSNALQAGFYDAAHFNRAFKELMGITPSAIYNSGIVQKPGG